jgi:hypothetical protein
LRQATKWQDGSMTSERAAAIADEFVAVNGEVIAFAESCTESQWRTVVPGEEWTVGVVIHHIAEGHTGVQGWLAAMVAGEAVSDTAADIDGNNVVHAESAAEAGIAETIALLQENGRSLERLLRGLSDEDLDRTAPFGPADGQSLPVAALAGATSRHPREHLAHAKEAVSSAPG